MSQPPPLLDFINATCMSTARLASCFPCAVVDINDSDDYVVDRLSRESAMNVMYGSSSISNNNNNATTTTPASINSPPNTFVSENDSCTASVGGIRFNNNGLGEQNNDDVIFIQLSDSEQMPQNDMPIQSNPSAIVEEDSSHHDDEDMHTISLNDGGAGSSVVPDEECVTDNSSTVMRNRKSQGSEIVSENEIPIYLPPKDPPKKKKKKFGMKLFGRKKKA